jgi:hypothetical protein
MCSGKLIFFAITNRINMSSSDFFYGLGDLFNNVLFIPFEVIGDLVNYSLIVLGFVGLFYWLNIQKKLNDKAANNPDQIK